MVRPYVLVAFSLIFAASAGGQCIKGHPEKQKSAGPKDDPVAYVIDFPYGKKLLSASDQDLLNDGYGELPGGMAEFARAIIFARHGRAFRDPNIVPVLEPLKWYKPNPKFSNSMLNETERKNLDIVRGIEAKEHSGVMPGDLRYWEDKKIGPDDLQDDNLFALHIMHAEIEAIHGKRFDDEPLVQKYFEDRYWYKPAAHYDPKSLSATERDNLKLIAHMESVKAKTGISPGSLIAYGERPIKPEMLNGLNLYQLRVLRNEIYAIRGAQFHTAWIQNYFDGQDWYSPLPKDKQPQLTPLDQRNVALIVKRETDLHSALSSKKLKEGDLTGMLSDDIGRLKDEIYARRGKVFKSKWLQSYFASMPWYKPDPKYSDKNLTPIERENVVLLAKYEKKATQQEDMTEG